MGSRSAAATAAPLGRALAQVLVCLWVAASASGPGQSQQLTDEAAARRGSALLQLLEGRSGAESRQAIAQDSDPAEAERTMVALDSNRDKHVDENELSAFADLQGLDSKQAVKAFSGLDSDGDGVLNAAELAAALGSGGLSDGAGESPVAPVAKDPKTAKLFLTTLDTNGDGHVDEEEVNTFAALKGMDLKKTLKAFMGLDANGDHSLNLEELGGIAAALASASGKTAPALTDEVQERTPNASPLPVDADAQSAASNGIAAPLPDSASLAAAEPPLETPMPASASLGFGTVANNASSDGNATEAHLLNGKARRMEKHALATVADLLEYARKQESHAEALETRAEELRAEAAMVARKGKEDAEKASSSAVQMKVQELMEAASRLDKEESELTVAAAQLRARSQVMLDQANDYMKAADDALLNATHNATAL